MRNCILLAAALFTSLSVPLASAQESAPTVRKVAAGTGFYISHDGYILSAHHVVANCSKDISAHNEEMVLRVKLVALEPKSDLALLQITSGLRVPHVATLRSATRPLHVGENIAVAGYPTNTTDLNDEFVSFATGNAKITKTTGPQNNIRWVQFSYIARPGFSGGPVLDAYGNIIGVTSGGSCMSRNCMKGYKDALQKLKDAKTLRQVQTAENDIVAQSDTNIAVSQTAIREFLSKNGTAMEERDSIELPSQERLHEIAGSIVNLRCVQNDEDFSRTPRVINLH